MRWAEKGDVHLGLRVAGWFTVAEMTEVFGFSDRHIRELEARGLPSVGRRKSKLYPFPHVIMWMISYDVRVAQRLTVERLPFSVAWAESEVRNAIEEAKREGTLRVTRRRTR